MTYKQFIPLLLFADLLKFFNSPLLDQAGLVFVAVFIILNKATVIRGFSSKRNIFIPLFLLYTFSLVCTIFFGASVLSGIVAYIYFLLFFASISFVVGSANSSPGFLDEMIKCSRVLSIYFLLPFSILLIQAFINSSFLVSTSYNESSTVIRNLGGLGVYSRYASYFPSPDKLAYFCSSVFILSCSSLISCRFLNKKLDGFSLIGLVSSVVALLIAGVRTSTIVLAICVLISFT